jgi:HTH-type transcriptional regulator, sugar sensing transcriptional regulator
MERETRIEQLAALGMTRYEAAVYVALLERRGHSPAQVAAHAGVPRQRIYDVLASLSARGLCLERHVGGQRQFVAVDPAAALPALLDERRRQFDAEQDLLQLQSAALVEALGPAFSAGSDMADPLDYVDVILDRRRVVERAVQLAHAAEREICVLFKAPLVGGSAENLAEVRVPRERGVRYRALYERALLDDPTVAGWVAQFRRWGQEARAVESLPIKCNLYDGRAALLSLQDPVTGTPSLTALCVTHPGLAQTLALAFEGLWARGEALSQAEGARQ